MAPVEPESGMTWLLNMGDCEDIVTVDSKYTTAEEMQQAKSEKDGGKDGGKDGKKGGDDKKDSAKSLQKDDDEDAEEDEDKEEGDDKEAGEKGDKRMMDAVWFTVTGASEGECKLTIALAEEGSIDWDDEDSEWGAEKVVVIPVTVGEAAEGDDEKKDEKKGDEEKEE